MKKIKYISKYQIFKHNSVFNYNYALYLPDHIKFIRTIGFKEMLEYKRNKRKYKKLKIKNYPWIKYQMAAAVYKHCYCKKYYKWAISYAKKKKIKKPLFSKHIKVKNQFYSSSELYGKAIDLMFNKSQ